MPALPPARPVRVQLKSTTGACWEATYSTAQQNTSTMFKARAD
jgi:hypothetical protein